METPEGIYILTSKSPSGAREYRVALLPNLESVYEGPDENGKWLPNKLALLSAFGRAPIFDDPAEASRFAQMVRATLYGILPNELEDGMCFVDVFYDRTFQALVT